MLACQAPEPQTGSRAGLPRRLGTEVLSVNGLTQLDFFQLDINFDAELHPLSQWGSVAIQFVGEEPVLYFNLAVNGNWRVRNMPVLSREGDGVLQSTNFNFDLGVAEGTLVTALDYAASLTTSPLEAMPAGSQNATVARRNYVIFTGLEGGLIPFSPPSPTLMGAPAVGDKKEHAGFPNQEAGKNECGPAGASNSLQWLKQKHGLAIPDAAITIAAMKAALGWNPATGVDKDWWIKKKHYKPLKGVVETSSIPKFSMKEVQEKLQADCDVEMMSPSRDKKGKLSSHIVAITGIQELANGDWSLDLTHDAAQGEAGGTVTESVTFREKTNPRHTFDGAPWLKGFSPNQIIAECPVIKDRPPPPPPPPPGPPSPPPAPPPGPPPPPPPPGPPPPPPSPPPGG